MRRGWHLLRDRGCTARKWLVVALGGRRRRFERDPPVPRKVRLDPRVRIARRDDLLVDARNGFDEVLCRPRAVPADQARRDADAAQHRTHRRREVLTVPAVTDRQEIDEWPDAVARISRRVERVVEERGVAEVGLDGHRLAVWIDQSGCPGQRQRADCLGASRRVVIQLGVLLRPRRIVGAGGAQLRRRRGGHQ